MSFGLAVSILSDFFFFFKINLCVYWFSWDLPVIVLLYNLSKYPVLSSKHASSKWAGVLELVLANLLCPPLCLHFPKMRLVAGRGPTTLANGEWRMDD